VCAALTDQEGQLQAVKGAKVRLDMDHISGVRKTITNSLPWKAKHYYFQVRFEAARGLKRVESEAIRYTITDSLPLEGQALLLPGEGRGGATPPRVRNA
jgi:hypothetical protein